MAVAGSQVPHVAAETHPCATEHGSPLGVAWNTAMVSTTPPKACQGRAAKERGRAVSETSLHQEGRPLLLAAAAAAATAVVAAAAADKKKIEGGRGRTDRRMNPMMERPR